MKEYLAEIEKIDQMVMMKAIDKAVNEELSRQNIKIKTGCGSIRMSKTSVGFKAFFNKLHVKK